MYFGIIYVVFLFHLILRVMREEMMKMAKKLLAAVLILAMVLSGSVMAYAEDDEWKEMPVITHVYEQSKEKIVLEWEGESDLYQIYVDGKSVATVNVEMAIIELKAGQHQLSVVPINYISKGVDTSVEINIANFVGGSIDLGSLGVDPKDLLQGTPSKTFKINYRVDPLLSAVPQIVSAFTDNDENVLLSFVDKYDSDLYRIAVKSGKDINYIEFDATDEEAAELISKDHSSVTIVLDQEFLKKHRCMIPELDQKFGFSVKLEKYPENLVDGEKENGLVLESKDSKMFEYTPYAAWKNAPTITYASQTADGQITLRWEHDDNGLGCQYKVIQIDKVLNVKKGEKELGTVTGNECVIKDLMNGSYSFAVVPVYEKEQGFLSEEATAEIQNNWVIAPTLECIPGKDQQILLKWTSAEGVENYHFTVSAGSGSLLRFVNLDFKKYDEFDVKSTPGAMEYTFIYDQAIDSENGVKLKFEVYGVRHATRGGEQKSATTTQIVTIK